ncbi:hypothetical protein MLD38_035106 [Melastoma candidum]|uniref:Uncharacterized protein n=1 Tax=Melastoma candidum TaxID=119954 RepID=A0ACB9MEA9_9MYRT|nr:hypothetical protein MLD38_035106 [Melastoma candidum]
MCLHRQLRDDSRDLCIFLRRIKSLRPRVVTVSEREGNHNSPSFLRRFAEAVEHYTALFESLEATLPPSSRERLEVEEVWYGREIRDIVAEEGALRKERHERLNAGSRSSVAQVSATCRSAPLPRPRPSFCSDSTTRPRVTSSNSGRTRPSWGGKRGRSSRSPRGVDG